MFILIVLLVAAGFGAYWYIKKRDECQLEYDIRFKSFQNEFYRCKNSNDYFEKMGNCILLTNRILPGLTGQFPSFIIKKISTNENSMLAMYKQLLQKLYDDCNQALESNQNYTTVLKFVYNMQDSVKYAPYTNAFGFDKEIQRNRQQALGFYIRVQNDLQSSFNALLSYQAPIEAICESIQKKQIAKTLIKNDNGIAEQFKIDDKTILSDFDEVQTALDNEFVKVAKDFLQKASYESVVNSINDVIVKSEKFINAFTEYQLKPKDNAMQIANMKNIAEHFDELYRKVLDSDDCYMIEDDEYGRCDNKFNNHASSMDTQTVNAVLQTYDFAFETGDFNMILSVDLKLLSTYVWHFAMLKPFSTEAFERICKLYNGFYKNIYTAEILLAELYYIKQMGGDTIIRNKINDLLDEMNGKIREMIKYNVILDKVGDNKIELIKVIRNHTNYTLEDAERIINGHTSIVIEAVDYNLASSIMYDINRTGSLASIGYHHNASSRLLTTIASGLMWIGAYDSEKVVLEYMLSKKLPMTLKQQERLHSLNNGGGDAPKSHAVTSSEDNLYFDISSISWRDDEYKGFFENLAFEEKILQYSIAVRDEDKELIISKRVKLPEQSIVLEKIKSVFEEEYGDTVNAKICHCRALSGTNQEELNGILVQSNECKQLGILVHMACIGKKFTIKFFSLFMPEVKDLNEQKQQLLSLYKKMSPSVTMWENSLKDTILIAFQQLLNELPSNNTVVSNGNDVEF